MRFKNMAYIVFLSLFFSGLAHADASQSFKDSCSATSATLYQDVNLVKYYVDDNQNHKGIFIVSDSGLVWSIPGAENYPDNYIAENSRKAAMTAIVSGLPVHICSGTKTSPNSVWAIEIG